MELEFAKYCRMGYSPKTVLPSHRHSLSHRNKATTCRTDVWITEENFSEVSFCHISSSPNSLSSKSVKLEDDEDLERDSIYQSSKPVNKVKKMKSTEGRRKIEFSQRNGKTSFPLKVVDSLCSSDEEITVAKEKRFSEFSAIFASIERDPIGEFSLRCNQFVNNRVKDSNNLLERDNIFTRSKSVSAKMGMPQNSPSPSESSPITRLSPIRKMFDPFMKFKSQRSLHEALRRNKTIRKSLLQDFSSEAQNNHFMVLPSSPAHLCGHLKMEHKHGVPIFEFSLKYAEDVLVAKAWKTEKASKWVYTFHSTPSRKKDHTHESSIVAQMQVSCYLHPEFKEAQNFNSSVTTEFVLYDIGHARKKEVAPREGACGKFESSPPYPWAPADLNPNHEVAAIIIEVPFEKRESLKFKSGDKISDKECRSLSDLSRDCVINPVKVKVITPSGYHGLPSGESMGPSPILDRWKLGGGCDCGGWDIACPLIVFGNKGHSMIENQQPLNLFLQGTKENTPALTVTNIEEEQYEVDFHAQLSSLQAFSICVAIWHCTENSSGYGQESVQQMLKCKSLKVFFKEEMEFSTQAVMGEHRQINTKIVEETPPSFVFNPPFSPIARV